MRPKIRPRDTLRGSKAAPKRQELDRLCREVVFRRDGCCKRCGRTSQLQWAHVYSRRFLSVRWDPLGSMILCAGCHLWAHHHPIEAGQFFEKVIGPAQVHLLALRKHAGGSPDPLSVKLSLEMLLKG